MKLSATIDELKMSRVFCLEFDFRDYVLAKFHDLDRRLLEECEKSDKVSDKLLALEMVARRIEEGHILRKEEKGGKK